MKPEKTFCLKMSLAVGDSVVMTPLIRDLKATYGNRYGVEVQTNQPAVFAYNPHISKVASPDALQVDMGGHRSGITRAGQGERLHFTRFLYDRFYEQTGVEVPMLQSKCDLHLSQYEMYTPPISGRYWLVMAGGKSDVTIKHWEYKRYQEVVDRLYPLGIRFVQSGGLTKGRTQHTHPPLRNVLNVVGWGGVREFIWQVAHAEGILCPITAAMHMASAFDKPCVVVAGGREEPWWESYEDQWGAFGPQAANVRVPHRYLHTIGQLECCERRGCWRNKVVRIDQDEKVCYKPLSQGRGQTLPLCMAMITVDQVCDAIMSYYKPDTKDAATASQSQRTGPEAASPESSTTTKLQAGPPVATGAVKSAAAWTRSPIGSPGDWRQTYSLRSSVRPVSCAAQGLLELNSEQPTGEPTRS